MFSLKAIGARRRVVVRTISPLICLFLAKKTRLNPLVSRVRVALGLFLISVIQVGLKAVVTSPVNIPVAVGVSLEGPSIV